MNQSDYAIFASDTFDASDYANAVLAGEPYLHTSSVKAATRTLGSQYAKEDVSVAITKLDAGIEDVSKQLKSVVTNHHEALLVRAASVSDLQGSLTTVRVGLDELDSSLEKLRLKIRVPYQTLQANVGKLEKMHKATDVLRRTSRFVILARRLETQMTELDALPSADATPAKADGVGAQEDEKERQIAKAALTVAELIALLDTSDEYPPEATEGTEQIPPPVSGVSLRSISAVSAQIPFVEDSRAKVTAEMENMILLGLTNLNQALLASSLQTAHNLRVLPDLVSNLIRDLSEAIEFRIKSAFDLAQISKEFQAKEPVSTAQGLLYKSRIRTEPTNITQSQWSSALWSRFEKMIEEMVDCCIKVYTLEKVLKLRKDHVSQVVFLDEAMKVLEEKPSLTFWHALARALEKQAKDAAKSSTFLQQTLGSGYPKLLRLVHEFFAKIALHTDTVYTQTQQSPETILVIRALSTFETLYLSKSSIRLNEAVGQAFIGGTRAPPSMNDGVNIARAVANELDAARFDPLLVKAVVKSAVSSLDLFLSRIDNLVVRDRMATTLLGPAATPQQISNSQIANCLYHCRARLAKLRDEYPDYVYLYLSPSMQNMEEAYRGITDPLIASLKKDFSFIISRLHRANFGRTGSDTDDGMGGPSLYMRDLVEKLGFAKNEIFANYSVGETSRDWYVTIIRHVIRTFVLHVSIVKPISEAGKLQLTTDMTELEFGLNAFMTDNKQSKRGANLQTIVGNDYRMLRALRPLLFLENGLLSSPQHTAGLPPLIILHHILVRSPIPLPHALHGWQEAEYVRWVDDHSEEEALTLIEGGISHWEKVAESEGTDTPEAVEYIRLARAVLSHATRR